MNPVKQYQNILLGKVQNPSRTFSNLKNTQPYNVVKEVLEAVKRYPVFKTATKGLLPKNYGELRNTTYMQFSNSFEKELNWNIALIQMHSDKVNRFLELQEEFEKSFLSSDYISCQSILDKIETDVCFSLWGIEKRLLVTEYQQGVEENWKLLSDVQEKINDPITNYLIEFYSKRAEKEQSLYRFNNIFEKKIKSIKDSGLREYMCFKINYYAYGGYGKNSSFILFIESTSSIIDRYLTLINVCQHVVIQKESSLNSLIESRIKRLNLEINSQALQNMLIVLNSNMELKATEESIKYFEINDLILEGKYQEIINYLSENFDKYLNSFEMLELYIESLLSTNQSPRIANEDSIIENVKSALIDIHNGKDDITESIDYILKIVTTLGRSKWSYLLNAYMMTTLNWTSSTNYKQISYLKSQYSTPHLCHLIENDQTAYEFLKNLASVYQSSTTLNLYVSMYGQMKGIVPLEHLNQFNITEEKRIIFESHVLSDLNDFNTVVENCESILNKDLSITDREDTYKLLFDAYLQLKMLQEALKLSISTIVENQNLSHIFHLELLIEEIEKQQFEGVKELIELPLIYQFTFDDSYKVYVAYDEFMDYHNLERPSELKAEVQKWHNQKCIRFLSDVCSIEVLHHSYQFEGTDDIEKERIKICQLLIEIDSINESKYQKEIAEITKKNKLRKGLSKVNQGRIEVNVEMLKSFEQNYIKEGFERYLSLSKFSKSHNLKTLENDTEFFQYFIEKTITGSKEKINSVFEREPAYQSFKYMFIELRDKFLFSNEYGLDAYLSTRIRHGALLNNIRSVFESLDLVTQRNDKGEYGENKYWKSKCGTDQNDELQKYLSEFSFQIDEYSNFIKEELIQIQTEERNDKPQGMFNFKFPEEPLKEFYFLTQTTTKVYTYEDFVEDSLSGFVALTTVLLQNIRTAFKNDFKSQFIEIINTLEQNLKSMSMSDSSELEMRITQSRTNIQHELDSIAEWFKFISEDKEFEFTVKETIEIAVEITSNIRPNYQLSPTVTVNKDFVLNGKFHTALLYACRIMLDNIISHSKIQPNKQKVDIDIQLSDDSELLLKVSNIVSESEIEKIESELIKVKDNWNNHQLDRVAQEGYSGFEKIKRMFKMDLNIQNLLFDYCWDSDNLYIEISMNINGFIR